MHPADQIREALSVLQPVYLEIKDHSHLHRNHAGSKEGGHFGVLIVSAVFDGQSRIRRQRMVYDCLKSLFQGKIHALSIQAFSPDEWK